MKKHVLTIILLFISYFIYSQVTLTRQDFVEPGNEIPTVTYFFNNAVPYSQVITTPLVFTEYSDAEISTDTIMAFPASEVDEYGQFPEANCAFLEPSMGMLFMNITNDKAEIIGISSSFEGGFIPDFNFKLEEPITYYQFPSGFGDNYSSQSSGNIKFHISILQDVLQDYYQIIAMMYDTVRVTFELTLDLDFDEFGEMSFEGEQIINGSFPYLREKRDLSTNIDIGLRQRFTGNYTSLSEIAGEGVMPEFITNRSYLYWTNNEDFALAQVIMDTTNTNIQTISIKKGQNLTSVCPVTYNISLMTYPNPASDFINFNMEKYLDRELIIYSVQGITLNKNIIDSENMTIDISNYEKGTYFYKVSDKNGNPLAGGKFIKN